MGISFNEIQRSIIERLKFIFDNRSITPLELFVTIVYMYPDDENIHYDIIYALLYFIHDKLLIERFNGDFKDSDSINFYIQTDPNNCIIDFFYLKNNNVNNLSIRFINKNRISIYTGDKREILPTIGSQAFTIFCSQLRKLMIQPMAIIISEEYEKRYYSGLHKYDWKGGRFFNWHTFF